MRKRGCQSPVTLTAEPLRSVGIRHTIPAGDVVEVGGEAVFAHKGLQKSVGRGHAGRCLGSALLAHQVHVRGGVDGVVHRGAMADVGVGDQAHIEQDVEGSVDGGCVDAWQLRSDLVGGRVAQALHRLPHVAALVGAPVAAVAQPGFETVVHTRLEFGGQVVGQGSPTALMSNVHARSPSGTRP